MKAKKQSGKAEWLKGVYSLGADKKKKKKIIKVSF